MDGDVITKFSHKDSLPNFLRYGVLRMRFVRAEAPLYRRRD